MAAAPWHTYLHQVTREETVIDVSDRDANFTVEAEFRSEHCGISSRSIGALKPIFGYRSATTMIKTVG
jgi:hypothetical protein